MSAVVMPPELRTRFVMNPFHTPSPWTGGFWRDAGSALGFAKSLDTPNLRRSVGPRMNLKRFRATNGALMLAAGLVLMGGVGCKHRPPRNTTPVSETQAPLVATPPRETTRTSEKKLQGQIDLMHEQIGIMTDRNDALAKFHSTRMGPKWVEKVQAARADASRESERMRYLEATKALLARKLQALQTERKVYEEFELSDPSIPRP